MTPKVLSANYLSHELHTSITPKSTWILHRRLKFIAPHEARKHVSPLIHLRKCHHQTFIDSGPSFISAVPSSRTSDPSLSFEGYTSKYTLKLSPSPLLLLYSNYYLSSCCSTLLIGNPLLAPLHSILCPSDVPSVSSSHAAPLNSRMIYTNFNLILKEYLIYLTHICFPSTYTVPDT